MKFNASILLYFTPEQLRRNARRGGGKVLWDVWMTAARACLVIEGSSGS